MEDIFNIYIDRLSGGREETIKGEAPSDFMDVHESDLTFKDPISLDGKAFISQSTLLIQLSIATLATMPCAICNEEIAVKINIDDAIFSEDVDEMRGAIFSIKELLREAILLEIPHVAECNGHCSERQNLAQYLKQN